MAIDEPFSLGADGGADELDPHARDAEPVPHWRDVDTSAREPRQLWLISYADFMTVLMIFFLTMYGYAYMAKAALWRMKKQNTTSDFMLTVRKMEGRLGSQIHVQDDIDKVTLELGEKILFPSGAATLSEGAISTIEELANSIKLVEGDVIIEGHTDDVPVIGGPFKSNWELSAARAYSVIEALSRFGVEPARLAAWGFGENRPVAPNDSAEDRAKNRRIDVVILKKRPQNG